MNSSIGYIVYSIGLFLYGIVIKIATLFNPKAKFFVEGRHNIFNTIANQLKDDTAPKAWFHCASLGEFEQARPIIESIKDKHPAYKIIITFFSPSGYEVRKNYNKADYIFYLPLDTSSNAKKLLALFKPTIAFFVKYEFWYHYLSQLRQQKIPTYLISANFRNDQIFFKWYGGFFRNILTNFDIIFTQNETSKQLLETIHINNVIVSKDTRFDRVYSTTQQAQLLPIIEIFKQKNLLLVAGSSYFYEESIINYYLENTSSTIKVIIAPHEIDAAHIKQIQETFSGQKTLLYSDATEQNCADADVLIINNIGLLASIYRYADIALIGGGFGKKGLHNTLEAATFGMPILFGPNNHDKFPEAKQLLDAGAAFIVNNNEAFTVLMNELINNNQKRKEIALRAKHFIASHIGSTDIILSHINLLK